MPIKVYYIDDEVDLCENFEDFFSTPEVIVKTFVDPMVAIEFIKSNPPDLLFIDYRLRGITGDEVSKQLDPNIPKILITGEISVKTDYKFLKEFSKPCLMSEISEVINSIKPPA